MTYISSYYMGVRLPEFRLQPEAIDHNSLADPFLEIPLRCQYLIELRCVSGEFAHPQTESPIFRIQITRHPEAPAPFSTIRRTYQNAFKILGLKGRYDNHDWRATYGTQLKEAGLSSAIVADLLGHADTRMVETTYAISRHQGIMKQKDLVNALNPYAKNTQSDPPKVC